ncbi:MAG: thioredoxin family protein [Pseudomonadota bacterium]
MSHFFKTPVLQSLCSLLVIFLFSFPAYAQERHVDIQLISEKAQVEPGETVTVGIVQDITTNWHTYWINPGDSGEPTKATWSGLDGIDAKPIEWPIPKKIPLGPLTNYGYEGKVVLLQDLTLPDTLPEGPFTLSAGISLLVCEEICIPEFGTYEITFNDENVGDPVAIAEARSALPIAMNWPVTYEPNGANIDFKVTFEKTTMFSDLASVEIFPVETGLIANAEQPVTQLLDSGLLISQAAGELEAAEIPQTNAIIAYNDASGERKGVIIMAEFAGTSYQGVTVAPTQEIISNNANSPSASIGFFGAVFFALFGGLILNLMPCVFPVLSLKALKLCQLKDKEEAKVRMQGLAYTAGVVLSFLIIAGILIGLKAAGAEIGWGFQLQNPAVVAVLTYILFLVGLNLSGYFEIGGSFMNVGSSLTQKDGVSGSFFTGVLATAVAAPCTAPFMGVAMGYALGQSAPIALAVFIALGLGLALPYLALCFVPSLRSVLPKPGAWMDTFKQFLAFPMFASAAWLMWVLSQQAGSMGVLITLMGLVTLVFGIWLGKKNLKTLAILALLVSIIPFFSVKTDPYRGGIPQEISENRNWQDFTPDALDLALSQNDPVFVNMTAAWCITCKVNERVALNIDETKMLFSKRNVQYFKGDWTNRDPNITKYLETYGRNGVPLYVYYGPHSELTGQRPEAKVLPQLLTPAIVRDSIE